MTSRVFALIVGIDTYQSGGIWNLHSCVEDAKKMKRWLMKTLNVPKEQILLLLDSHATKQAIEDSFMHHLVNNPSIERGDSLVIYFAGHGSCLLPPPGWFEDNTSDVLVNVICPYDHDTKVHQGRNAGISDRSLISLLEQLELAKGNNITVFLDCCFSPVQNPVNILDRSITRWTQTFKATPDDLYRGLWPDARGKTHATTSGLFNPTSAYTLLAACPLGHKATEGKGGGRFTTAFIAMASRSPIHRMSYARIVDDILLSTGEAQQFICSGKYRDRVLFDDVPFTLDESLSIVSQNEGTKIIKVDLGQIHGVVDGSEMTVHLHNYRSSPNPPIAVSVVQEVHPTYCLARIKSQSCDLPEQCWAKVTRWNNRRPFRVYLKSTFRSFMRVLKLKRSIRKSATSPSGPFENGVNILTVNEFHAADISVTFRGSSSIVIVQNNPVIPEGVSQTVQVNGKCPVKAIDDSALINLHLLHQNANTPLKNLIDVELYELDPASLSKVGQNFLHNGQAMIERDNGAIYDIVLHNNSKFEIWPYLFYIDPNRQRITLIYNPDLPSSPAPLPRQGSLEICVGRLGTEASHPLTLPHDQEYHLDFAYLKLYLSSVPVNMKLLQQDPSLSAVITNLNQPVEDTKHPVPCSQRHGGDAIWDTSLASLIFFRESGT